MNWNHKQSRLLGKVAYINAIQEKHQTRYYCFGNAFGLNAKYNWEKTEVFFNLEIIVRTVFRIGEIANSLNCV